MPALACALAGPNHAIERDPSDADAYVERAQAYDTVGDWARALRDYSRAIELDAHRLDACFGRGYASLMLRDWFTGILDSEADADALIHRCQRLEVEAGDIIVQAGDPADSMHFILEGRVGIMVPAEDDRTTRVRSLGRYTTIGEMGLVSNTPRSATIQAEVASVLYVLNTLQFDAIRDDDPALSHKLLTYFVSVMAERLTFANRTIAVLRR